MEYKKNISYITNNIQVKKKKINNTIKQYL